MALVGIHLALRSLGQWWVGFDGNAHGPCSSREEALQAAFDIMAQLDNRGCLVEIWSSGEVASERLEWSGTTASSSRPDRT